MAGAEIYPCGALAAARLRGGGDLALVLDEGHR
jgi:hypothetical protein